MRKLAIILALIAVAAGAILFRMRESGLAKGARMKTKAKWRKQRRDITQLTRIKPKPNQLGLCS